MHDPAPFPPEHGHSGGMLIGVAASSGIARGPAFVIPAAGGLSVPRRSIAASEVAGEVARFEAAVVAAGEELVAVRESTLRKLGNEAAAIFEAQMWILHDPALQEATLRRCRQEMINVEAALSDTVEKLCRDFSKVEDAIIRDRAADLRDIGLRVLRRLLAVQPEAKRYPVDGIVVTEELLPSLAPALDKKSIRGLIAERGGPTAHAVILARALGIPTLLYVEGATRKIATGDSLIVDGLAGRAFIRPSPAVEREYDRVEADLAAHRDFLKSTLDLPATTRDGTAIALRANIGKVADAAAAAAVNAAGVGLYRTEFVFLVEDHFPTEEEQYQLYRKTAECLPRAEMVIRVLDLGSDKSLSYFPLPIEPNPSLGQRGTRLLLSHPEILEPQLRAILRLSATHPVAILFPMIGGVSEIVEAKRRVENVQRQLEAEKIPFNPGIRIGAMIETPSAALTARYLAQEVDFLSVGTNDLTQYLLASDRSSREMTNYYEPLHPAVMLSLKAIFEAAAAEGKDVSVCGEMAGNPAYTELLLGLGLRSLSVGPAEILEIKRVIRSVNMTRAKELAQAVLAARTTRRVKDCLAAVVSGPALASAPRLLDAKAMARQAVDRWENEGGHLLASLPRPSTPPVEALSV